MPEILQIAAIARRNDRKFLSLPEAKDLASFKLLEVIEKKSKAYPFQEKNIPDR